MLVLGDAHAEDPDRREALLAAYDAADEDLALQVGDLGYYDLPVPTWFIAGNNEDHDAIEALRGGNGVGRNAYLLASDVVEMGGLRVAGLSGNYAPTKYECSREELVGERRRHFVRSEVERAMELEDVDVFLAHEAPHGLIRKGYDRGCKHVDEILDAVEPELCLVGHHHEHAESSWGDTQVVSLAPAWESYYVMEGMDLRRREAP